MKRGEDYLETIYNLSTNSDTVRSIDVAKALGVTKPSTFKAFKTLAAQGYIEKENYGTVVLTAKGKAHALEVLKKHKAICTLLRDILGVSVGNAETDACQIEHCISTETTEKLYKFLRVEEKI